MPEDLGSELEARDVLKEIITKGQHSYVCQAAPQAPANAIAAPGNGSGRFVLFLGASPHSHCILTFWSFTKIELYRF